MLSQPIFTTCPIDERLVQVHEVFHRISKCWTGCHWPTEFGPLKLQLQNIRAYQALMLANATCGEEANQWNAASKWLIDTERAANCALQAGELAVACLSCGRWQQAWSAIEIACSIQIGYLPGGVWLELREAMLTLQP